MSKQKTLKSPAAILAETVIKGIQEKKGKEIVLLDLRKIENAICDYFIICHGDSSTQVSAIANSVDKEVKKDTGEDPWHSEGYENSEWVLIDYVDVVVHVFQKQIRDFYKLEKLWGDAEITVIPEE